MTSFPPSRVRIGERLFKVIPGGRKVWSSAGAWERFFILAPVVWMAYLLVLLTALVVDPRLPTDPRLSYVFYMLMGLIFTFYLVLLDSWRIPLIFSSRVLRSLQGIQEFKQDLLRNERAYASAIAYLDSLGHGGRWRTGNLLSLSFFIVYLIWGLVALRFPDMTGIEDGVTILAVFFAIHLPAAWLMFWAYRKAFRGMTADAARKGFPFLDAGQF